MYKVYSHVDTVKTKHNVSASSIYTLAIKAYYIISDIRVTIRLAMLIICAKNPVMPIRSKN